MGSRFHISFCLFSPFGVKKMGDGWMLALAQLQKAPPSDSGLICKLSNMVANPCYPTPIFEPLQWQLPLPALPLQLHPSTWANCCHGPRASRRRVIVRMDALNCHEQVLCGLHSFQVVKGVVPVQSRWSCKFQTRQTDEHDSKSNHLSFHF